MDKLQVTETRELLLGTWIALALIVEVLIDEMDLSREDLLLMIGSAEALARGKRRTALSGIRLLIERGFS